MPIIIPYHEAPQGSERWRSLRMGIPTASEFSNIIKKSGERSDSRGEYLEKLADERLRQMVESNFESSAMKRGKVMEPESRETFEDEFGLSVTQVAFVYGDERRRYGCSPDGLIYDYPTDPLPRRGFETKDGKSAIQIKRLKSGKLPSEHYHQVQGSMWVCDCETWYFRSYCRGMRALTIEVPRDEKFIKVLSREIEVFCDELDHLVEMRRAA